MLVKRGAAVLTAAALAAGCGASPLDESPIAVVADQTAPPVPALPTEMVAAPSAAEQPVAPPAPVTPEPPPPPNPAGAGDFLTVPVSVPSDVGPELHSVFTLVQVMTHDPGRAGERGDDLLKDLRRVLEEPQRDRIDQALTRIRQWTADQELNGEVAAFARSGLEQARAVTVDDRDGDDDDSDDDNDNGNNNGNGRGGDTKNDDHDGG